MEDVAIVAAVRTPIGKLQGSLASFSATQLGGFAVRELLRRSTVDPKLIDECIMGNVLSAGLGQAPARQCAIFGGLPYEVAALTVNKVCGSGLKAVALAAQAIQTGNAEIVVAGGIESMTNAPYLLPQARAGYRMGNGTLVDSMVQDGLIDVYNHYHMGMTAEKVARKHCFTREQQDAYAVESHRRAVAAWNAGRFGDEVFPIEVPPRRKDDSPRIFQMDESIRPDTSMEALAALKPAFMEDGTVTAGNAPGVNDAAAALLVMSAKRAEQLGLRVMAYVKAQAASGVDPQWIMLAPVSGVRNLMKRAGWTLDSVDLYELNEAFAIQAMGVTKELGLDLERVNVNGGAIALGHPIGASGARILVTLLHEMVRRDAHKGVAALCLGGGNSVALAVER